MEHNEKSDIRSFCYYKDVCVCVCVCVCTLALCLCSLGTQDTRTSRKCRNNVVHSQFILFS
jgi:hypothetical protein